MSEPTSQEVINFWDFMTKYYGSSVKSKSDSTFMSTVGWALGVIGVQDKTKFMDHYTTTIGKTIYVPFKIGEPNSIWSLWGQIVVCVHEHMHVLQYDKDGLSFMFNYLTSSSKRGMYEAEAYRSNLEMHWHKYGQMMDTFTLANALISYNVSSPDIMVVKHMLDLSAASVRSGAIINETTSIAINWLENNTQILKRYSVVPNVVLNPLLLSIK